MKSIVLSAALLLPGGLLAQEHSHCAAHSDHSDHDAQVDSRGDAVMGFDHDKTTHGFRLTPRGGVIEVMTNDPKDTESREAIQAHLAHIAKMFAAGDFDAPMLIHGQQPPGVDVMKREKDKIEWKYVETEHGGRVVARSEDAKVREAIHEFLRFQIAEHRTGDSPGVQDDDDKE
jgi:hypothetical protein